MMHNKITIQLFTTLISCIRTKLLTKLPSNAASGRYRD